MANILNADNPPLVYHEDSEGNFSSELMSAVWQDDSGGESLEIQNQMGDISKTLKIDRSKNVGKQIKKKPIYDFNTRNKSFLSLYNDLCKLWVDDGNGGKKHIKNNKFFLALYDKELQGIDPYLPNLPMEIKIRIHIECLINPWYWLREICRIPEDGTSIDSGGGVMYRIDRNNLAGWYLMLNGIDTYRSKPRQCGKTQDIIAFMNYCYHYGTQSTNFSFFNKKEDDSKLNLARLKIQRDLLPTWMQMKNAFGNDGAVLKEGNNVKTMKNPMNNNKVTAMPKASTSAAAMSLGRGHTTAIQFFDEFDFTDYNITIVDASVYAYRTAAENARRNGAIACRVFSSTPGDQDSKCGRDATEYVKHMLVWNEKYFDFTMDKLREVLKSAEYNGVVFIEHTWQQLKKSQEWYAQRCKDARYDPEVIAREIELKRLRGNNRSPFKPADILYISRNVKEPVQEVDYSKCLKPIYFYEPLDKRIHYILAVDPSEGLALDNNAITLINPYTTEPAAEFQCSYMNQTEMSEMIVKFMDEHAPESMIVVENNKGRELIHRLMDTKYKYRLWFDEDKLNQKIIEKDNIYGHIQQKVNQDRSYGLTTTTKTRNMMLAILEDIMETEKAKIRTKYLVDDVVGLVRTNSGKIEAGEGGHDDNILSYLIGLCVYYHASNLDQFGIRRGEKAPKFDDPDDPVFIRGKIKELLQKLPEKYQGLFDDAVPKTEVDDINQAVRDREQAEALSKINSPYLYSKEEKNDMNQSPDLYYSAMMNNIFTEQENYEKKSEFNIDDFL